MKMMSNSDDNDWQKLPFKPDWCVPPGATISECLEMRGMTPAEFAKKINTTTTYVQNLIHGNVAIDEELATKLSTIIGSTPRFWLNLEKNYRDHPKSIKLKRND